MKRKIYIIILLNILTINCFSQLKTYNFGTILLPTENTKMYKVNITVDTVMKVNQKNENIHCDFEVLYIWEYNYLISAVVKKIDSTYIKTIKFSNKVESRSIINFYNYHKTDSLNFCKSYISACYYRAIPHYDFIYEPDTMTITHYYIPYNNELYEIYATNMFVCNKLNSNQNSLKIYFQLNEDFNFKIFNANYYLEKTEINNIKNQIYYYIFNSYNDIAFPNNLPLNFEKTKVFQIPHTISNYTNKYLYNQIDNIIISKIINIQGKALYIIKNKKKCIKNLGLENDDLISSEIIYIPHILFIDTKRFTPKIKSINDKSLENFLQTYNDNFQIENNPKEMTKYFDLFNIDYHNFSKYDNNLYYLNSTKNEFKSLTDSINIRKEEELQEIPYMLVERNATFKGGDLSVFNTWVYENFEYPNENIEICEGTVVVQFVVSSLGNVVSAKILKSSHNTLIDCEAIRVVMSSPKWEPAEDNGKNVAQIFNIPIQFNLNKK